METIRNHDLKEKEDYQFNLQSDICEAQFGDDPTLVICCHSTTQVELSSSRGEGRHFAEGTIKAIITFPVCAESGRVAFRQCLS